MILILYLTLMYKTMGGGSWSGSLTSSSSRSIHSHVSMEPSSMEEEYKPHLSKRAEEIEEAVLVVTGQFSLAWQSLKHVRIYNFLHAYLVSRRTV